LYLNYLSLYFILIRNSHKIQFDSTAKAISKTIFNSTTFFFKTINIMKFSTIVLALATTIVAPAAAAEYVCHTEAIFTYASEVTPSISTQAREFLGTIMVETFNEAYVIPHDDIPLDAEVTIDFVTGTRKLWTNTRGSRCGPTCDDSRILNSEVVPAGVRMLWTNTRSNHCGPTCSNDNDSRMLSAEVADDTARKLVWQGWSRQLYTNTRGNRCGPTCSNDDDDARMLTSSKVVPAGGDRKQLWTNTAHGSGRFTDDFGDALKHVAWEKLLLEKGRTHTELDGLKGATIVLSDCHIE